MTSQSTQTHAAHFNTEVHGYRFLNETTVRTLAQKHGFNANDTIVRQNADQAENAHGKPCGLPGQSPRVSWGTDSRGFYDAARLLDGLLDQEAQTMRVDGLAHREFERNAYGS